MTSCDFTLHRTGEAVRVIATTTQEGGGVAGEEPGKLPGGKSEQCG